VESTGTRARRRWWQWEIRLPHEVAAFKIARGTLPAIVRVYIDTICFNFPGRAINDCNAYFPLSASHQSTTTLGGPSSAARTI
jgi:hypothetical protein